MPDDYRGASWNVTADHTATAPPSICPDCSWDGGAGPWCDRRCEHPGCRPCAEDRWAAAHPAEDAAWQREQDEADAARNAGSYQSPDGRTETYTGETMRYVSVCSGREAASVRWTPPDVAARARAGDAAAFEAIVRHHQAALWALVYRRLGHHVHDADDAVQQTWFLAWRALSDPRSPVHDAPLEHVWGWLQQIATNVCLAEFRRRRRRPTVPWELLADERHPEPPAPDDPEGEALRADEAARLWAALGRLPSRQRTTLWLRHCGDRTHAEIAAVLGTTVSAVDRLAWRARQRARAVVACP